MWRIWHSTNLQAGSRFKSLTFSFSSPGKLGINFHFCSKPGRPKAREFLRAVMPTSARRHCHRFGHHLSRFVSGCLVNKKKSQPLIIFHFSGNKNQMVYFCHIPIFFWNDGIHGSVFYSFQGNGGFIDPTAELRGITSRSSRWMMTAKDKRKDLGWRASISVESATSKKKKMFGGGKTDAHISHIFKKWTSHVILMF